MSVLSKDCTIRPATPADVPRLVELYNSNPDFLKSHLGVEWVDSNFIQEELDEMAETGYRSCVLTDKEGGRVAALCDYKPGDETYLSLLMLDAAGKGMGFGRRAYGHLEAAFRQAGARRVRIDVVEDYEGNVIGFWEKQGFVFQEHITLRWGGHAMRAQTMKKELV